MLCVLSIVNKLSKVMPYMMPKQLTLIFDEFEINSKFPTDSHEKGQILFFCLLKIVKWSGVRLKKHNYCFKNKTVRT